MNQRPTGQNCFWCKWAEIKGTNSGECRLNPPRLMNDGTTKFPALDDLQQQWCGVFTTRATSPAGEVP